MPRTGDFPHRQRVPRVKENVRPRRSRRRQDKEKQSDADRFDRDEQELHRHHGLAEPGRYEKQHLRDRRIDRRRVVVAVDVRKDRFVAQRCELSICRDVTVGVDPGGLNASIPNVTEDVVRKVDRRGKRANAEQNRRRQDHRECRPSTGAAPKGKRRKGPDRTLQQSG